MTRLNLAVVIAGLVIYVGYLHLQLWDARALWRHQAGLTGYYSGVLTRGCVMRPAFEAEADARGLSRGTSEFADYDPAADSFRDVRSGVLTVKIEPPAPFAKDPMNFILFSEDGCFEWGTFPSAP